MKYRVSISEIADLQIEEFELYLESQKPGLADRFTDRLFELFQKLEENPHTWQKINAEIRRAILKGFPYNIFYEIIDSKVIILAIIHQAADPGKWPGST